MEWIVGRVGIEKIRPVQPTAQDFRFRAQPPQDGAYAVRMRLCSIVRTAQDGQIGIVAAELGCDTANQEGKQLKWLGGRAHDGARQTVQWSAAVVQSRRANGCHVDLVAGLDARAPGCFHPHAISPEVRVPILSAQRMIASRPNDSSPEVKSTILKM